MANGTQNSGNGSNGKARKAGQGSKWLQPTTRTRIELRDNFCCVYCGCTVQPSNGTPHPQDSTIDHVVPSELGGSNRHNNLVTCCQSCNSAKGKKSVTDFVAYLAEKGVDTEAMRRNVRNATRRKLPVLPAEYSNRKTVKEYRRIIRAALALTSIVANVAA